MEIIARNVNDAIVKALSKLCLVGKREDSRNGPVIVFPEPVMTTYERPQERVLFWQERDCNPVFHLLESIWMLAGRRDVKFVEMFNSRIGQYSDDTVNFNAAYGYRWRTHFGYDQLAEIINLLTIEPNTRRAVMQIWEPEDLRTQGKDLACNTQVYFEIREGRLNMTVLNRSNDIWYGAYGANAVHFSFMMEFIASAIGVSMGVYRQFSHNLHLYTELYDAQKYLDPAPNPADYDAYRQGIHSQPIMDNGNWEGFLKDCEQFCDNPFEGGIYNHSFFNTVAFPMAMVSKTRKDKSETGMEWAESIRAPDWKLATRQWINRREKAKAALLPR